jgi:hypothetical protein
LYAYLPEVSSLFSTPFSGSLIVRIQQNLDIRIRDIRHEIIAYRHEMTGYLIPFFLPGIEIFLGDLLVIDYIGRYIGIAGQKETFPWNTSYIPYRLCIRPVPG